MDRAPGTIHGELVKHGGVAPQVRCRRKSALTMVEREEISRGVAAGESVRQIARKLGRAPSTVSREINRNGGRDGNRAHEAEDRFRKSARRPQVSKLQRNWLLRNLVADRLSEDWSPEQISGWLRDLFPDDHTMEVSHETIYLALFIQTRGALKRELISHLRRSRAIRRPRGPKRAHGGRGQIKDAISIRARPVEVEDRAVSGHWEGDLLTGKANSHVATLVERHSWFLMLVKVDGKDTKTVTRALVDQVKHLPEELKGSLT